MVGQLPLEKHILVRIQAPQLFIFRSAQNSESSLPRICSESSTQYKTSLKIEDTEEP